MASLHKLLTQEEFDSKKPRKSRRTVKFKEEDSIALPIFICRDRRRFDSSWKKAENALSLKSSSVSSLKRGGSGSEKPNARSKSEEIPRGSEPAIDDVAVKAMVSILSCYIGRYLRDKDFRERIKEKCRSCFLKRKKQNSENEIVMEQGIRSIESLVENQDVKKEMDLETLQNSIKLLNIVVSTDSSLCACAQLYLSIAYKIAKNDKISARYLLQVFIDSPFLARRHLLPELWEHLFLPHLLHVKIWYNQELEFMSNSEYVEQKRIKALNEQYNGLMDNGTTQFALYYKEWLKIGGQAPPIPSVSLPSKTSYAHSRRRSSSSSTSYHSISDKSLYQEVFGVIPKGRSMDQDNGYGSLQNLWDFKKQEKNCSVEEKSHVEKKVSAHRRSSIHRIQKTEQWPESQKPDFFRFLACLAKPTEFLVRESYVSNNEKIKHDDKIQLFQLNDMNRAIDAICSSESLSECETAIRTVSEVWLNSNRGLIIETSLSEASVIKGIMEVLFVSNDDEVLELAISILAELATKNEMNRQHILNSDPHLEVSIRLLQSSNLFLKAASLLYLMKPKAEQMILTEWVPLVLRVLEFGDQSQTLFTVRCNPHEAAYYFLDQLVTGFDEDRNLENARQIISLGGLRLFVKRMDLGDTSEKNKAASILHYCIQADGSCRYYLARNLKIENIASLLVIGEYTIKHTFSLLTELLCLSRTKQRKDILTGLMKGWDCLNTMQILLLYLQKARPEEQPMIAVVLLQLDFMGDILKCSVYREEAIDALVKALDCRVLNVKVQEQLARALLVLAGHFSYTGEPEIEKWLLRKAGFDLNAENSLRGKDISIDGNLHLSEEDKSGENWKNKVAKVLLTSGNRRLIVALSDSIANSIPCLARASLVTVCWMSNVLNSLEEEEKDLQLMACSKLVPPLIDCLNNSKVIEERILASYTLLGLTKGTGYFCDLSWLDKNVLSCLHELSRVTWTGKELISLIASS